MGGSSSKNKKKKENKPEENKQIKNEKEDIKFESKKDKKEENNNENININTFNNNEKKEEKIFNNEERKVYFNDIEELTLENNGALISNKNTVKNFNLTPYIIYTEKVSQELIINFYEKMIDIIYNINIRRNFIALVKSLNESYLFNINVKNFPRTKETDEFFNCFKYSSLIIICLIFLTKDTDLFNNTKKKVKEYLEHFIFSCLDNTNTDIIISLKIINFMNFFRKTKKSLYNCTNQIIRILFKNKSSYLNILNCLEQLLSKINTESTQVIIDKINNSILFYYNASTYNNINENNNNIVITKRRKSIMKKSKISLKNEPSFNSARILYRSSSFYKGLNQRKNKTKNKTTNSNVKIINNNENEKINENKENLIDTNPPFIKEEMQKNKKFCLVLDIDETISHLIKLPFGNYFLIRPGVIELLNELYNYYEIDIFTAALPHYADNILNKLDKDNKYFSYRLYRCHCNWEEGKSIKKLSLMGRDLNKIVFVDDIERNAKYNMKNLILVSKWSDNIYDDEIIIIKNKLKLIAESDKYDDDITVGLIDEKLSQINFNNNNDNNG